MLPTQGERFLLQQAAHWEAVRGFTPLSLCDWPGRTAAVLFLGGCNLACPTCHNAALAWAPDLLPHCDRERVLNRLQSGRKWIRGVVVTGGEPTLSQGLLPLLRELKAQGLPVKLDSNGMLPRVLEQVLEQDLAKEIHVDVKGPYALYPALTGQKREPEYFEQRLRAVFALARQHTGVFLFRTTLVPGLGEHHIDEIRALLPDGFDLKLQDYKPVPAASS